MQVRFLINVGSRDASIVGLAAQDCCRGMVKDVSDPQAELLVSKRLAEPVTLKAVAKTPVISETQSPTVAKHKATNKES